MDGEGEEPTRKTDAKNRREKSSQFRVAVSRRSFASILRVDSSRRFLSV